MKNFNSQEDELFRSLFSEAGSESPSKDFHLKILSQLQTKNSVVYQPLISATVLKLIVVGILLIGLITLLFIPGSEKSFTYLDKIPEVTPSILNFNLPKLTLPKIHLGPIFNTSLLAFSLLMFSWILYYSKKLNIE
jgi:hypothetical protein